MSTHSAGYPAARNSPIGLLAAARSALAEAGATTEPGERFRLAHLSALRTAAALCGHRSPPSDRPAALRRKLMSVWVLLERVAPEHTDWATYFAAGAQLRAAVEAGSYSAVSPRVADDQVRAAGEFLALVEDSLGLLAA
jgi:HEPN superfamily protein